MGFRVFVGVSFVFALLVSLLVHLPASWLWQFVPNTPGLVVSGISGTPWKGSASQIRWQQWVLGEAEWTMFPWKLLTGDAAFKVSMGRGSELGYRGDGTLGINFDGPYAKGFVLTMSAQQVVQSVRLPIPLTLGGSFTLTLNDYRFASPYCQALDGVLTWNGALVGTPMGEIDLGPVNAELSCNDGQLAATSHQKSNQVESDWQASLSQNQTYSLNGWFTPGAELPANLRDQLKWLGSPDASGRYPVRYSGRL
ncbi:type II secretion system protein N [Photobacterium sp. 53610]|uniref:type II secretion system protein N n=1 Tax=Photobacterium sp. 53610 TaxID=3102789 RepID=UPI002ED9B8D1